jgi:N-succinyldiaminopimelate aminotransferase
MHNSAIDLLTGYPFDRLRSLLGPVTQDTDAPEVLMSLGEPQHAPPAFIAEIIAENADAWGRYPPMFGPPELLEVIGTWLTKRYALPADAIDPARHIVAVSGSREALFMAAELIIPRRKISGPPVVLIPNPFYQVYYGAALMSGAQMIFLSATEQTGFLPDVASVDQSILRRTAMMYLCSPANPNGTAASLDYLKEAIRLARQHDFVLAVDECYGEIYDKTPPPGALQACAELGRGFSNVLVFNSLSKRSSAPGLRSGFVAGDDALIQRLKTLRSYGGANLATPIAAASTALWRDEAHVEANRDLYRAKFDRADRLLKGKFDYRRPDGGFFLWLNVGDGEEATRKLWAKGNIRVLPGLYLAREDATGVNPGRPYIRVALVHDPETITDALERMISIL